MTALASAGSLFAPGGNSIVSLGPWWIISAEPHVMLKLKRIFAGIAKEVRGEFRLRRSPEVDRDIEWILDRWEFTMSAADRKALHAGAEWQRAHEKTVAAIMSGASVGTTFEIAVEPRDYQKVAATWWHTVKRCLLADQLGLGKTISALTGLSAPGRLPALIVCQSHLTYQWREQILRCFPSARVHIVTKGTVYDVAKATGQEERRAGKVAGTDWPDFTIINYHKLAGWSDALAKAGVRSIVYDEVQELRHSDSQKYAGAVRLAGTDADILGLSATPVWNYGGAFINVADVIRPGFLGERAEFFREWCSEGEERKRLIIDPRAFGKMLRESGFMLKRDREEVGRELPTLTVAPHLIDTEGAQFAGHEHELRALALRVIEEGTGREAAFGKMRAAGELDIKLRKITGVAKAPYVADLAKMVVESGEKVVIGGWHREFWDILAVKLKDYAPAFYTGHESPAQKAESRRRFVEGETPILCVSLASCAGLDGLQDVCATGIVGELAWTPKIIEQLMGRLHRDGQSRPVTWLYCYTTWGSDPIVMDVCGVKESQSAPIVNPDAKIADVQVDPKHVQRLAEDFLRRSR
jgi:SNF2 family DNA or RNA helicase